jgi:hypothetical protein
MLKSDHSFALIRNNANRQSYWHILWMAILVCVNSLCNLVKYLIEIHQQIGIASRNKSVNGRVPLASVTHKRKHNMSRWHALATMRRQHAPATNVEQCQKNYPEKFSMHHYREGRADIKMEMT